MKVCLLYPRPPLLHLTFVCAQYRDTEYTLWDRFEIEGDITLEQLVEHFKEKYKLEISMLSSGCVQRLSSLELG